MGFFRHSDSIYGRVFSKTVLCEQLFVAPRIGILIVSNHQQLILCLPKSRFSQTTKVLSFFVKIFWRIFDQSIWCWSWRKKSERCCYSYWNSKSHITFGFWFFKEIHTNFRGVFPMFSLLSYSRSPMSNSNVVVFWIISKINWLLWQIFLKLFRCAIVLSIKMRLMSKEEHFLWLTFQNH